jgi:hypothetical protein
MPLEASFPALYHSADRTSWTGQQSFLFATRLRLIALCAAALLVVLPGDLPRYAVAGAFAIALAAEAQLLNQKPERHWYGGRAGAESAKTLAWRYCAGGDPFPIGTDADALLQQRLEGVLGDLKQVRLLAASETAGTVTQAMRDARALPLAARKELYERERLADQQAWYARKAAWNGERATFWSWMLIVLEVAALTFACIRIGMRDSFGWPGIAAAIVLAGAAWLQTKQYQNLASAYSVAALELAGIQSGIGAVRDEESWARFVAGAEDAMSREHTLGRARRP